MSLFGQQSSNSSPFGGNNNNNNQQQSKSPLFGSSTTQTSSAGTLFGTAQPQQSSSASPFGQLATSSQPASSSSLFGTTANQQTSSGLFGTSNNNNDTQTSGSTSGGLFGRVQTSASPFAASTNAQSSAPSLFGGNTQTAGQTNGSSLFGGNTASNANQNTSGGGLFGSSTTQSKPTLSLFSNTNNTTSNTQQKPSPFGSTTANSQQPSNSLFGASTSTQQKPFSLSLGQPSSQPTQQQTVPGVKIDVSNIRGTTRFSDLHDTLQDEIIKIDNFIAQQIAYKEQCEALLPAHSDNVASLAPDVQFISGRCEAVEAGIDNDGAAIKALKGTLATDADDARRIFRAVENLKLPSPYQYHSNMSLTQRGGSAGGPGSSSGGASGSDEADGAALDLTHYFSRVAGEMGATLRGYEANMAEIERHLGTVEAGTVAQGQALLLRNGQRTPEDQVRELAGVLREFEHGILGVAGRVGALREGVEGVIMR